MSYSALYRKLRPARFTEVVGQGHIVKTLKNQLKSGRVSHAYLFCGTRGTGKTTLAKIFAKSVNCENPVDGDCCGVCSFCSLNRDDLSAVIFEIDAASNNGVDNIRDLRDEVNYLAPYGEYKVYIIDEVHMLSGGAFNALLKTLEEPPAHVIFILATTEPQKIPATIHSRCQRFDFHRISSGEIAGALARYMTAEGILAEEAALKYIARAADGSMRDALSILDQCISFYYGEELTLEKTLDTLGATDDSALYEMSAALYSGNAALCLSLIDKALNAGRDLAVLAEEMLSLFRDLIILKTVRGDTPYVSPERAAELSRQAETMELARLMDFAGSFSELIQKMKYSSNQRILMELHCVKLCSPPDSVKTADTIINPAAEPAARKQEAPKPEHKPAQATHIAKQPQHAQTDMSAYMSEWPKLVGAIKDAVLRSMLLKAMPGIGENGKLCIVCPNVGILDFLKSRLGTVAEAMSPLVADSGASLILQEDYDKKCASKRSATDNSEDYKAITEAFGFPIA